MSHTSVDVFDFILFTFYPVIFLFAIELVSRLFHFAKWIKLLIQGLTALGFAVAYVTLPDDKKFPLTAAVLIFLSIALFYQTHKEKNKNS